MLPPRPELQTSIDPGMNEVEDAYRRAFLGKCIGVATFFQTESLITRMHWPDTQGTNFLVLPSNGPRRSSHGWIGMPGYGGIHGRQMAEEMRDFGGISRSSPIGVPLFGNKPLHMQDLDIGAQDYVEKYELEEISGNFKSLGGRMGLAALLATKMPARNLILNGAPYDADDANEGSGAEFGALVNSLTGYQGGIFTEYIATLWNVCTRNAPKDALARRDMFMQGLEYLRQAGEETWKGASPSLLVSQMRILVGPPPVPEEYEHTLISGYTNVIICIPQNPRVDRIVKVLQATDKWVKRLLEPLKIEPKIIRMNSGGHARNLDALRYTRRSIMN